MDIVNIGEQQEQCRGREDALDGSDRSKMGADHDTELGYEWRHWSRKQCGDDKWSSDRICECDGCRARVWTDGRIILDRNKARRQ